MELVLISKSRGALGRLRIGRTSVVIIALLAVTGFGGSAYWGFIRGADQMADAILNNPDYATSFWQNEIVRQRKIIANIRRDADGDISALASKVGTIQAYVTRLDAISRRLVVAAQLDPDEFGLTETPAIGGPEPSRLTAPQWDSLLANIEVLDEELLEREDRLNALEALLMDRQLIESMSPSGRPLDEGWISSGFGYRTDPVSGMREFHSGIDFAAPTGLDVRTVGSGIVTWSGRRWGFGNLVEVNHGNGYVTRYAHNKKNLVDIGQKVEQRDVIALLGATGRATGPHVHFEVLRDGKVVNPWKFIKHAAAR